MTTARTGLCGCFSYELNQEGQMETEHGGSWILVVVGMLVTIVVVGFARLACRLSVNL